MIFLRLREEASLCGISVIPLSLFLASSGSQDLSLCSEREDQLLKSSSEYNLFKVKAIVSSFFEGKRRKISYHSINPAVHEAMGCDQKKLWANVAVPPAPAKVPSQRSLAPSVTSVMSVI